MNKLHQAVLIFTLLVVTLIIGAWQLIQTEMFSKWMFDKTNDRLKQEFGINVSFQSLEIDMFPPSTVFKKVVVKKKIDSPDIDILVEVDELGVYLGLWDLLSNKISIEKVLLQNGLISINFPALAEGNNTDKFTFDKKTLKRLQLRDLFNKAQVNVIEKLPVNLKGVMLHEVKLNVNDNKVWIDKAFSQFDDDYISLDLSIEQINYHNIQLDLLALSGTLYADNFDVEKLVAINKMKTYSYKGKIIENKYLTFDGVARYKGNGKELVQFAHELDPDIKTINGYWELEAELSDEIFSPSVQLNASVYDLHSNYLKAEQLDIGLYYKKDIISLNSFRVKQRGGSITLDAPKDLFNVRTKELINNSVAFNAQKIHTNDVLFYIRDTISSLKGRFTGKVNVSYENKDIIFRLQDNSSIEMFSLEFSPDSAPVLQNPSLQLPNATFTIKPDGTFLMDTELYFANSHVSAKGEIRSDYISINAISDDFSFKDFGEISGVAIVGDGKLKFSVDGPMSDVRLYFDTSLSNTNLIDLDLGNVEGKLRLDLKDLNLYINELKGKKGTSQYTVKGKIQFEEEQKYELYVKFPYGTYRDSLRIYNKFLPIDLMPKGLAFYYSGDYHISGSLNDDLPKIIGNVQAKNLTWFNENVDALKFNFVFDESILNISSFRFAKQTGEILGTFLFDLSTQYLEYSAKLENLRLKDIAMYRLFNFGYDGKISGIFKGDGKIDSLVTQTKLRVTKGNIFNKAMRDSRLIIYTDKKDVFVNGAILGNIVTLDSYLNFDMSEQDKRSYLNAAVNSTDVKILTGFISEHNSLDASIKGRVSANLESTFSMVDWNDLNLLFEFEEFAFRRESVRLKMNPVKRNVIIRNGEIKHWDVLLKGNDGNIYSRGKGHLSGDYEIESGYVVDSSIMEMFFPVIQKSTGLFSSRWLLLSKQNKTVSHLESVGEDLYLKLKVLSDSFEKINFAIAVENDEFFLQKLDGKFGQGSISADGNISLKYPYPEVDLKVAVDQSRLTFFQNSSIVLSGDLRFSGKEVPYSLNGDIALLYGEILDEFSDYDFGGGETVDNKFIPKPIDVQHIDFFDYNLDLRATSPIIMRNQMVDLQFGGNLSLGGTYQSPELKGEMVTIDDKSRFMFKGHEFDLKDGKVIFDNDIVNKVPNINVSAVSTIQNYKVKVDVSGRVDDFDVKLSSDPVLSQQDILSLLTLGITSDIANNLDESDRESITSLGLGSLIVDQFKLNRGLDSSLGLKLSVLPAFGESNESMLHGRKSGTSTSTKIKSATKVKVQTKLKENVDLSFSSTLGGSMNQKQEMNLNYNLGDHTSLKFIYETEESANDAEDSLDSIGVDFTFRKTFR